MATLTISNVRRGYGVTPEIYLHKPIDNSRLVRVEDPRRQRETQVLCGALLLLLALLLAFCWQHYSAIQLGYDNEIVRQQCDQLRESSRQLQLEDAQLREPRRIDGLAHQLGLQTPIAGQFVSLDSSSSREPSPPVMARAAAVFVVSAAP